MLLAATILLFVVLYFTTPFTIRVLIDEVNDYPTGDRQANFVAGVALLMLISGFVLWLNFAVMLWQSKSIVFFPYMGIITPAWPIFVAIMVKRDDVQAY